MSRRPSAGKFRRRRPLLGKALERYDRGENGLEPRLRPRRRPVLERVAVEGFEGALGAACQPDLERGIADHQCAALSGLDQRPRILHNAISLSHRRTFRPRRPVSCPKLRFSRNDRVGVASSDVRRVRSVSFRGGLLGPIGAVWGRLGPDRPRRGWPFEAIRGHTGGQSGAIWGQRSGHLGPEVAICGQPQPALGPGPKLCFLWFYPLFRAAADARAATASPDATGGGSRGRRRLIGARRAYTS
jgi:hypothetical protein